MCWLLTVLEGETKNLPERDQRSAQNGQTPEGFLTALWAIGMMSVAALNTSFKEEPEHE
jgi:hypothetical protein